MPSWRLRFAAFQGHGDAGKSMTGDVGDLPTKMTVVVNRPIDLSTTLIRYGNRYRVGGHEAGRHNGRNSVFSRGQPVKRIVTILVWGNLMSLGAPEGERSRAIETGQNRRQRDVSVDGRAGRGRCQCTHPGEGGIILASFPCVGARALRCPTLASCLG